MRTGAFSKSAHSDELRIFAGLSLILLSIAPPLNYGVDGSSMLAVAESIVSHGDLTVPCAPGQSGPCYSVFYLLQSLALVPFVALGRVLGELGGIPQLYGGRAVAMALPALCTAGAGTFTYALATELGASRRRALGAALAFVFCTIAVTYSRTLFAEPLGALCLAACCWGLLASGATSGRRRLVGLVAGALVVTVKPQLLLAVPAAALALAVVDRRLRALLAGLAVTAAGSAIVLGYNALRFGSPLEFGGPQRGIDLADQSSPALDALDNAAGLLVSPNNGLLVFAPVALVAAAGLLKMARSDRVAAICLGGAVGVFGFAVLSPNDGAWGPRYLLPMLPLVCVGIAALGRRMTLLACVAAVAGFVVQAPTTVSYYQRQYRVNDVVRIPSWDFGHLEAAQAWPTAAGEIRNARRTDVVALVDSAQPDRPDNRLLKTVALWWWVLPAAGIPAPLGATIALLMAAGGAILVLRVARAGPSETTRAR